MKVLFLDIDGVLNNVYDLERNVDLNNEKCCLLSKFVLANDITVVISSSWRIVHTLDELRKMLRAAGLRCRIIDMTATHPHFKLRGDEIKLWLDTTTLEIDKYAIIDDNSDMRPDQKDVFVKTDFRWGIQPKHIKKLSRILECE